MIYVLLAAFIAGLSLGAGGVWQWKAGEIARHEQAQQVAQKKIDDATHDAITAAANNITDMEAAYQAGEANAKTITKTVYLKGQSYVASTPVFSNPVCVVPDDGMLVLNSQRAGVRAPADTVLPHAAVPSAGADPGRKAGDPVPANPAGHGPVGAVHPKPRPID